MTKDDINSKLKEINIEDRIWLIYIGIIFLSWQANYFEKKYYLNNDLKSKKKYQSIMIFIFTILLLVYAYFLKSSYDSVKKIKPNDSNKKKLLIYGSYLASLLIFISGLVFLLITICDNNLDVEVAFD